VRCGLDAVDCIVAHWCPVLGGQKERAGWRARCPVCQVPRALSLQADRGRVLWNCHHEPACPRQAIWAELVLMLPGCLSPGRRMHPATGAAIEALVTDRTLTPAALRMAILRELGWTNRRIRAELKLAPRTYYRAVQLLAQRGVPEMAQPASAKNGTTEPRQPTAKNGTEPQVTESSNAPLEQLDSNCYSDPAGRRRIGVAL
jgi:hypothetical protein